MSRFAILRVNKLKTLENIAALGQHCQRQRVTPNADPTRRTLNQLLAGTGDWRRDVEVRLEVLPKVEKDGVLVPKVRTNAVLAIEHVLTASPEFFTSANVDQWRDTTMEWLRETYGEANTVGAVCHMDETSPHVQAVVVPIDGRGHLNARAFVGGRERLIQLQDSYAKKMEPLGLERGVCGSVAQHQEVKRWYAQMWEPAARVREELESAVFADSIAPRVEALVQQVEQLSRKVEQQERQIVAQAKRERLSQAVVERTRQLDLGVVMEALGGVPDPGDKHKRRWSLDGQEFSITGHKFYNVTRGQGGGGAIDLVMHVRPYNFRQAVAFVRDHVGADAAAFAAARNAQEIVEREPPVPFRPPEHDERRWSRVRMYLEQRSLPSEWVDTLHQQGKLYADRRSNAVFLRENERGEATGASLYGNLPESTATSLAPGTQRDAGWFSWTLPARQDGGHTRPTLILASSPIEALSVAEMYRQQYEGRESGPVTVVSTDGGSAIPHQHIGDTLRDGGVVRVAVDNNDVGERMWQELRKQYSPGSLVRDTARLQSWNEVLRWRDLNLHNWHQAGRELQSMWQQNHPQQSEPPQQREPDQGRVGKDSNDVPRDPQRAAWERDALSKREQRWPRASRPRSPERDPGHER